MSKIDELMAETREILKFRETFRENEAKIECPTVTIKCAPLHIGAFDCYSWLKLRDGEEASQVYHVKPELWDLLEGADKVETLWKHWESCQEAVDALKKAILKLNGEV